MKKILFAALFACTQAFAIIGVGAHYVTNTGTLKGETETITIGEGLTSLDIDLKRKEVSTLQGLGFKLWIDILPFIDVEGTFNIMATRYETSLVVPIPLMGEKEIPLEFKPDAPYNLLFDKASPLYGLVSGDLSVTKPFDVLPVIRPYVGVGISYIASIPVINKKIIKDMEPALVAILTDPENPEIATVIGEEFSKALKKMDYNVGIGGHVIAGARFKLPLIPIAAYANTKYYFGDPDKKFTQGAVFELGGGFAL
ncbi:MAG: hypothetical protein LBC85_05885 [Fibromonadaceae bacterium]|jgi:hypothetical protein|nr:hypothetical protein [Fibromonadaceae bacterium]